MAILMVFTLMLAIVITVVMAPFVVIVAIVMLDDDRSGNNYCSSMMSMMPVMNRRYVNTYANRDLACARRIRPGKPSDPHDQSAENDHSDAFSMFHCAGIISNSSVSYDNEQLWKVVLIVLRYKDTEVSFEICYKIPDICCIIHTFCWHICHLRCNMPNVRIPRALAISFRLRLSGFLRP
jgi:hypothetical protein